ncbi:bifunctional [glutamate--ammonia ligase]-adenylyl-L-tyrosine phosphorylase/[glutamate--ammonia-ligase] adenylyltransferase [Marinicellulosiphila megalodicopiae]|uniref:bifunctional [glutamate--ammonia ligase]-adenylyl-L-tyrosine phosphorylase/[glutamate--ammonia-ligase] adenylyltransferase n=1 Tax=Marinicellulosiphila megalodicopiae TaxID=2724896 RepID=UPI003BAF6103
MLTEFKSLEISHLNIPSDFEIQFAKSCFCSEFFKNNLLDFDQNALNIFLERIDCNEIEKTLQVGVLQLIDFVNTSEDEFKSALRIWRNQNQMLIIFMDSNQLWSLEQVLTATSKMADVAIELSHNYAQFIIENRFGKPSSKTNEIKNSLSVLAMGKLGAFELNLSSDIDLIFVYPFSGNTIINGSDQKSISNQEFFIKVARKIIDYLHQVTQEGFVYRVDMRLRPWGQGGELVLNQTAFFKYYIEHGRDWERFAMVKMRPVCGDPLFNESVIEFINQFVYRAYVDFQAIEALRDLKNQINKESLKLPNLNVKLGRGGIREIEFIVQSFQLVRGGNVHALQTPNLFEVLNVLNNNALLDEQSLAEIKVAYIWLRKIEHAIQAYQDKQGQVLPNDAGLRIKIAKYIGLETEENLLEILSEQTKIVTKHFENCIQKENKPYPLDKTLEQLLVQSISNNMKRSELSNLSEQLNVVLAGFINSQAFEKLTPQVRDRVLITLNYILQEIKSLPEMSQETTFNNLILILESVLRRSSYLTLLNEHPFAIFEMVRLVYRSKWIAQQLIEKPFLFDELIDHDRLYHLPSEQELSAQLRLMMLRIEQDDLEQQMESLRQFKHARVFRAGACEVMKTLGLGNVSDYLTQVANVVVKYSLHLAFEQMIERFGFPEKNENENENEQDHSFVNSNEDLSIIAYGKMGGFELNYHSDLDVVFIYNSSINGKTDGVKSIENIVFYTKVVQRFMHILNSKTYNGQLYEVDMRLRPSGNSGSLVCSLDGFKKYQLNQAWTWEHQALVRTRSVAGMDDHCYVRLKTEILTQVDKQDLRDNIVNMRNKMIDQLGSKSNHSDKFNIKQDRGGLVDIEFMVQYWVLKHCEAIPQLCLFSDNLNILDCLAINNVISKEDSTALVQAYMTLRSLLHAQILQDHKSQVIDIQRDEKITNTIKNVEAFWHKFMVSCAP